MSKIKSTKAFKNAVNEAFDTQTLRDKTKREYDALHRDFDEKHTPSRASPPRAKCRGSTKLEQGGDGMTRTMFNATHSKERSRLLKRVS